MIKYNFLGNMKKKVSILFIYFLIANIYQLKSYSNELIKDITSENSIDKIQNYAKKKFRKNDYIFGPGDSFYIQLFELDDSFIKEYSVDGDGFIKFDRVGDLYVEGLSKSELEKLLNKEYETYLKDPSIKIYISNYRPINVTITGEIIDSGVYTIEGSNVKDKKRLLENDSPDIPQIRNRLESELKLNQVTPFNANKSRVYPSLINLIKLSGGITNQADLSNISVIRNDTISNGGGRKIANINLIKAFNGEDASQNIRLFDGDFIKIPPTDNQTILAKVKKIKQTNLNPKFINIIISGSVKNGGNFKLPKSAALSDALKIAGGTNVLRGKVSLLRYNNNGDVENIQISKVSNSSRDSRNNPALKEGDIIYVAKGRFRKTTEILSDITSPLEPIIRGYTFYKIID